jgi:AcrR family transcriptional regulator
VAVSIYPVTSNSRTAATQSSQERRTRASREKILDAAVKCLIDYGYAGASTLKIQQLAGVSRGRLLHHFASRDDLLVGAVHHLAAGRVAALRDEAETTIKADPDDPARIEQAVARMWADFHQPYFWASVELWIGARHSEGVRDALGHTERALYQSIFETLDALFGPVFSARPKYRQVMEILVSSMRGASMTYAFQSRSPMGDPHLAYWTQMARDLLAD